MRKKLHENCAFMHPSLESWHEQERRMFNVAWPHIQRHVGTWSLPDLLLFSYLLGLNHAFEAAEKSGWKQPEKDTP